MKLAWPRMLTALLFECESRNSSRLLIVVIIINNNNALIHGTIDLFLLWCCHHDSSHFESSPGTHKAACIIKDMINSAHIICKVSGCVCVWSHPGIVWGGLPNRPTGEIYSVPAVWILMTGESIPGVECMGKVVALGSTISSYGKWPTQTLTL